MSKGSTSTRNNGHFDKLAEVSSNGPAQDEKKREFTMVYRTYPAYNDDSMNSNLSVSKAVPLEHNFDFNVIYSGS